METILPILIALAFFGLQAYANFQKEQEKARKRNPAQGRPRAGTDEAAAGRSAQPGKVVGKQQAGHRDLRAPAWQPDETSATSSAAFDAYTGNIDTAKMRRARSHSGQRVPERLHVTDTAHTGKADGGYAFDLRDAVIQSAILERPYQ